MRQLEFVTVDVFTEELFGGNQLAVFLDAAGLDDTTMQRIAREFNLSETAFVLPPTDPRHTRRVRIFTPSMELPFAGHPTIGTAIVLAQAQALGEAASCDMTLEEAIGPVSVRVTRREDGTLFAALSIVRMPEVLGPGPSDDVLCRLLGLQSEDLGTTSVRSAMYSAGVPFTIVPVVSRAALSAVQFDLAVWRQHIASTAAPHLYVVHMDEWTSGTTVSARMFAPSMGIPEDPATGAAAAALAGFLQRLQSLNDGTAVWHIRQGDDMGRPSRIQLEARAARGRLLEVQVGGAAVNVSNGKLSLPR